MPLNAQGCSTKRFQKRSSDYSYYVRRVFLVVGGPTECLLAAYYQAAVAKYHRYACCCDVCLPSDDSVLANMNTAVVVGWTMCSVSFNTDHSRKHAHKEEENQGNIYLVRYIKNTENKY